MRDQLPARRRALRRAATIAERALWYALRDRRLGAKFRRQHAIEQYIVDFYCPAAQLVVEIDGGQHYEEAALACDERRTALLEARGAKVIRFTNTEVMRAREAVLEVIARELAARCPARVARRS